MEEKQMLYINVMICDSDSNRIIDLENKLEEIGELEHIKINIETRHELELQTIENWLPETYDILFINLDRETHQELTRAGKIREKDEKIHMILTSENQENIQETFDLMPAVYLITPLEKESLRHWIQTIQKRVKDRRLYITFNYKRKTYRFSDASGDYDREICSTIFNCYGRDGRSHYSCRFIGRDYALSCTSFV